MLKKIAKNNHRRCYGKQCVTITSPDRILFPKKKITKLELIDYYETIAPIMLPYMKDRMLTMHRFPEGIDKEGFYHKNVPDYFPAWIKRVPVKTEEGATVNYMVCNTTASLVYLANAACITPHMFLSKVKTMHKPDQMIFDLDPSNPKDFASVKKVAWILKTIMEAHGLVPFVKTTGSHGLHVVIPLKPKHTYDEVRAFARHCAEHVVAKYPKFTTLEMRKDKRAGKVFLDVMRNSFGATAVCPYAVRAHPGAPIAMPLVWNDLKKSSLRSQSYNIYNAFKRLHDKGDAWKGMQKSACVLPALNDND